MEKDTIKDDREDFAICLDHETEQRKVSQDDLEFAKLEKQWDERDVNQRKEEGRPCLTINKLPSFIKQVTNDGRLNRASINVKPVGDGASKHTSDILSDLIRNIETQSQSNQVYDTAFDFAVTMGYGYFRVNVDYAHEDAFEQDIMLERISNPFSVYGDYEGKEATSIDWNRAFVTDFYSKSAFEARWGKNRKAADFDDGGDYDKNWFKDKKIRVAERWLRDEVAGQLLKLSDGSILLASEYLKHKEEVYDPQGIVVAGERDTKTFRVKQRLITGTDVLEESVWLGKYIPIVPMYGEEVNVNGVRHFISLVRRAKDSQRLYNYQRTLSAELGGLQPKAPWLGPVGMFASSSAQWATANRVNHAYLEYDVVPEQPGATPQRIPFNPPPSGAIDEAMMASDDMKDVMGLHDASLGKRSNETSGVAINARAREGDTSTFDFIDNRNKAIEHGGRIIVDLIPKVYTAERIMRCVQEDGTTYTVPVNQPVAPKQAIEQIQQPQGQPMPAPGQNQQQGQEGPPEYVPVPPNLHAMLPPDQLARLQAVTRVFDLTTGKYDVLVTTGPGFTTRREAAATQMMDFLKAFPQAAPLIGDLVAKNLDWPGADQVAERLKAMLPPQAAGQVPAMVQQLQQQLQAQDTHAKDAVSQLQQQIAQLTKENADKTRAANLAQFDAQTKRMAEVAAAAKDGFVVVQDPATGNFVPMPMQQGPVQPQQPTPDALLEAELKNREYAVRERELMLKEAETAAKVRQLDTQTAATHVAQVQIPMDNHHAMIAALHTVAQGIGPKVKRHRIVKNADGSFDAETVETPASEVQELPQQQAAEPQEL